ncbi:uncharacterized protein [Argopecten irradians]|uniref:uncharacterized protein n=1 Tax=Argopecten irradians TaxID=31199 RepID=UPI0037185BF8
MRMVSDVAFYHFGLENMLGHKLSQMPAQALEDVQRFVLALNIDGCPLFKSTGLSAWPVLACVTNIKPRVIFPISIAVGVSKPKDLNFLVEAISDLDKALREGYVFNDKQFTVHLQCVICDAPAKAFVKCTKQYSGYYGCDKCCQKGFYIGRMTYPLISLFNMRTNTSFRNTSQPEHHKGLSPFTRLPIDMIEDFPIDYMHQVCLGVVKKLILRWIRGPIGDGRLSATQVSLISSNLQSLRPCIPREFARKPRKLEDIDRWKATELRQFLLYTGQFVLKDVLSHPYYNNFMVLSVAICILVSEEMAFNYRDYAHQLLQHFVSKCKDIYGREFLVYNVHSLVHLKKEVEKFGCLDKCAAWPFESYMQTLKRKVHCGQNPASQIVKRVLEENECKSEYSYKLNNQIYTKKPDNAYKIASGKYCEAVRRVTENSFMCRVYHSSEALFERPCDSRTLGFCMFNKHNYAMKTILRKDLVKRCLKFEMENQSVFLPLLHDFSQQNR